MRQDNPKLIIPYNPIFDNLIRLEKVDVYTRNGDPVRILAWDVIGKNHENVIGGLKMTYDNDGYMKDEFVTWSVEGFGSTRGEDLFVVPVSGDLGQLLLEVLPRGKKTCNSSVRDCLNAVDKFVEMCQNWKKLAEIYLNHTNR